jgi:hypothetical protein
LSLIGLMTMDSRAARFLATSAVWRIFCSASFSAVAREETSRRAYLFPVPCEFFAAIVVSPWCIAVARETGLVLLRPAGLDLLRPLEVYAAEQ